MPSTSVNQPCSFIPMGTDLPCPCKMSFFFFFRSGILAVDMGEITLGARQLEKKKLTDYSVA